MANILRRLGAKSIWTLCRLLPVRKNKVVFSHFGGKGFGDNPKAIAKELLKSGENLDLVWVVSDVTTPMPKGIRVCRYGSVQAAKELSTARVWVNDSRGGAHYKRKKQYYMQTWHGFALKCIERSAKNLPQTYVEQGKRDSAQTDVIVSNSAFMTKIYKEDFWYDGVVEEFGSPRNDIFFRDNEALHREILETFGIEEDRKLLLYAPTFRDDGSMEAYRIEIDQVLAACQKRFGGKWSALMRLHPNVAKQSAGLFAYEQGRIVDATAWADMQELLATVDLLITDYSSSMFDFILRDKPCIRFATDLEQYRALRNFYFPLEALPMPLAQSNDELCALLESYDSSQDAQRRQVFMKENGFCEDGEASRRCAQWILSRIKE